MGLSIFQDLVNTKATNYSSEVLPNEGKYHAAIAMSKLFDETGHHVEMIVGTLDGNISNQANYLESLEKCLERGVEFDILFLEGPNEESKAYQLLRKRKEAFSNQIHFKKATNEVKTLVVNEKNEPVHFAVFDEDKYRYEKDTMKYLAWFCFNDPTNSEQLDRIFKLAFNKSEEIN